MISPASPDAHLPSDTWREGSRQHNWDRLRVVASLDIVGSHLSGQHVFGGVGTPLFLLMAVALGVQQRAAPDSVDFVRKRARRVLLPWLFWSLLLTTLFAVQAGLRGEQPFGFLRGEMLLYGPQIHLWFLPFVACAGVSAHGLQRATASLPPQRVAAGALLLGVGSLTLCPWIGSGWPFEQWSFSLPAVLLGFGVGRLMACSRPSLLHFALPGCAGAVLLLPLVLPEVAPYAFRYAGALLLLGAAVWLPGANDTVTPRLASLMLGAYILHPWLFRDLVEPCLRCAGLSSEAWARTGFGFAASLALVALLRRGPLRALL